MKHEIQRIISGESKIEHGAIIQAAADFLKRSQTTSKMAKGEYKQLRKEETEIIESFSTENNLWVASINLENFVAEGAEQKVYPKVLISASSGHLN